MRRYRRPVVQLTSLLDLLFVMIFVSLMQTKVVPPKTEAKPEPKPEPVAEVKPTPVKEKKKGKVAVSAEFFFYPTRNSGNIPDGKYRMEGTYDYGNGALQLGGVQWIKRPKHYDMVPLKGSINKEGTLFTGNIEFPQCETFQLAHESKVAGSIIAGKWVGTYVCSQGETGLTLTIVE
jgi:hypothetical protein